MNDFLLKGLAAVTVDGMTEGSWWAVSGIVAVSIFFGLAATIGVFALGVYSIYRGFLGDSLLLTLIGIVLTGFFFGVFIYAFFSFNEYYKGVRAEKRKKNNQRSQ